MSKPSKRLARYGSQVVCAMTLVALTGCGVQWPNLRHPGHVYQQRLRATYHDPYASVQAGPEVVGGRPIMYERPRPQPVQTQWFLQ